MMSHVRHRIEEQPGKLLAGKAWQVNLGKHFDVVADQRGPLRLQPQVWTLVSPRVGGDVKMRWQLPWMFKIVSWKRERVAY